MVIGYALSNLLQTEGVILRGSLRGIGKKATKWLPQAALVLLVFGWVPLSLWFRYAVKLPFMGTTGKNGAVEHLAWREAAAYVSENKRSGDVVISTLPLTVQYYLGSVDYNLNMINLDETLRWSDGLKVHDWDFYTGAPAIQTVQDLQDVVRENDRGFIIVDVYRFERRQYVPTEVARYIRENFRLGWEDPAKSIRVYEWGGETTS
jgi:hypothetical protein